MDYICYKIVCCIFVIIIKVEQGHKSHSCIREDYCDGEAFSSHALFSAHINALQILFYFDELEVANPIGSKAKIHKLGCYIDIL